MHRSHAPAIVFGPLQSRRLGRSLGVNNVPPKRCSYSCIYCQAGATDRRQTRRAIFYTVPEVAAAVAARLERCRIAGDQVEYVTFVPAGEPTLDANLGAEIRAVRELGRPVAVLTNGSLLTRADVRRELMAADVVSVKVDAVHSPVWRRINRPASGLRAAAIRDGMRQFASDYRGRLLTESMILAGVNDGPESLDALGRFLAELDPYRAYLGAPTRAPATSVRPPDARTMARVFARVAEQVGSAGLLLRDVPVMLAGSPDAAGDLLSTVAVHPLTEAAVLDFLERSGRGTEVIDDLVGRGAIGRQQHGTEVFFVRAGSRPLAAGEKQR